MSPLLNQNWANIGAKHLQITDLAQQKALGHLASLRHCRGLHAQAFTMSVCVT
jgi:hypothetical protein